MGNRKDNTEQIYPIFQFHSEPDDIIYSVAKSFSKLHFGGIDLK
jgi:hypothetical protein